MTRSTVHCYVFDTLADWEHGVAVSGINNTQFHRVPDRWSVRTVAPRREPIVTAGGVRIIPDMTLDELRPSDSRMLILPGGDTWDEGGNTDAVDKARAFLASGVPVAAICGAKQGLRAAPSSTNAVTPATRARTSQRRDIAAARSTRMSPP